MAIIDDLIAQIDDKELQGRIAKEVNKLTKHKKFGLVYEEHIPECTPLYGIKIKKNSLVARKDGKINEVYKVVSIEDNTAQCLKKDTKEVAEFAIDDLVCVAEFGEPIYPYLEPIDTVCNAPDSDLWHTLIEADNYHALQLLAYLYPHKVDCIYIDPPYNSGAHDWKYNNNYVDSSDAYRHSKWLSFMEKRLRLAKKLLNPIDSILIVTIDEKEYLHLGLLLEEVFPEANMQMVSSVINRAGTGRKYEFSRTDEYLFFLRFGEASIALEKGAGENTPVVWDTLRRSGPTNTRDKTNKQFYPVFIDDNTHRIHSVGQPIPKNIDIHEVVAPAGCTAVFPIRDNGMEMMWGCVREEFINRYEKGYIRVGRHTPNKPQKYIISYLTSGIINDIESGKAVIESYNEDGSVNAFYLSNKDIPPTTNWNNPTHDAQWYGSSVLKELLGSNRFIYPKSLYAVKDCIYYATASKPNALILDFFAGSGTTLHAINLLNKQDGGNRRCIMVTNNEVSEAEAKELSAKGYKPGDSEWEKYGIAQYVTWPRTVNSIIGQDASGKTLDNDYGTYHEEYLELAEQLYTSDGKRFSKKLFYFDSKVPDNIELSNIKKSEGFKANAAYYKLGFLDKNRVSLGKQFRELLPLLWLKAGSYNECPRLKQGTVPDMLIYPKNRFAVLVNEAAYMQFEKEVNSCEEIATVYIVTDSQTSYREMIKGLNVNDTYQLYRDYLDNFRINTGVLRK